MPSTGPSEGSLNARTTFLSIPFKPSVKPMEMVVLPSPAGVGVIALTKISLPSFVCFSLSSNDRSIFAISLP